MLQEININMQFLWIIFSCPEFHYYKLAPLMPHVHVAQSWQ